MKMLKFYLDGCDIQFVAEAPEDMTLKQLLDQSSRIDPDWCACGVRYCPESYDTEIVFDYNDVHKVSDDVSCSIIEPEKIREHWGL